MILRSPALTTSRQTVRLSTCYGTGYLRPNLPGMTEAEIKTQLLENDNGVLEEQLTTVTNMTAGTLMIAMCEMETQQ